jgi:hypothetical protein
MVLATTTAITTAKTTPSTRIAVRAVKRPEFSIVFPSMILHFSFGLFGLFIRLDAKTELKVNLKLYLSYYTAKLSREPDSTG